MKLLKLKTDRKYFSLVLNGNDDIKANTNMVSFSGIHRCLCEKRTIKVGKLGKVR